MNHSKIEWLQTDGKAGYSVNPVKGYCPMACPYCYARRMYDRFGWDKTIRFTGTKTVDELASIKNPARIFWGSTIELFGDWIQERWLRHIFEMCRLTQQHTHIFLTKQPQNLAKWSPFPPNCYVGVSCTDFEMYGTAGIYLPEIEAKVKFISFEPLLARIQPNAPYGPYTHEMMVEDLKFAGINWLIIGAETGNRKEKPPLEQVQGWAREIIKAADKAGIPVFTKDNLKLPVNEMRREWPKAAL